MLFFLLLNVKMPTIVGILTFMSRKISCSTELSMFFFTSRLGLKHIFLCFPILSDDRQSCAPGLNDQFHCQGCQFYEAPG